MTGKCRALHRAQRNLGNRTKRQTLFGFTRPEFWKPSHCRLLWWVFRRHAAGIFGTGSVSLRGVAL